MICLTFLCCIADLSARLLDALQHFDQTDFLLAQPLTSGQIEPQFGRVWDERGPEKLVKNKSI